MIREEVAREKNSSDFRILEFFERSFDVSGCCMSRRSEIFFSNNSQKFLSKF